MTPAELVARAAVAGVTVLAVTDHDTVGGCEASAGACATAGIAFVTGIEMTAVVDGGDVHVLGYFIDPASPALNAFLAEQRRQRINSLRLTVERLAALGIALNAGEILQPAVDDARKSVGRPWIARALVDGGHAASSNEAFERWLGQGKAAFVPRCGAAPPEVIARIHEAGGIASLAHPGVVGRDEWISGLASCGLDAIEAYHSKHDAAATSYYLAMASAMGVAVSGGSDYHGDSTHGPEHPGAVCLPRKAYKQLRRRHRRGSHAASPPDSSR